MPTKGKYRCAQSIQQIGDNDNYTDFFYASTTTGFNITFLENIE
jgi:hypothetical protein